MPSISERALRAAFHARTEPDYIALAVAAARQQAQHLATETHWQRWDWPTSGGRQQAACGTWVDLTRMATTPTCPACRQQLALFEALEF
jgi:hypothetical protein